MSLGEVSMSLTINAKTLGLKTGMALFFLTKEATSRESVGKVDIFYNFKCVDLSMASLWTKNSPLTFLPFIVF